MTESAVKFVQDQTVFVHRVIQNKYHYHPQRSCGKVMFSQVCVKNSVQGGVSHHALGQTPSWADTPPGRHPPGRLPQADTPRRPLQRTVHILLECILVITAFSRSRDALPR